MQVLKFVLSNKFCPNEGPTLLVCSTNTFLNYVSFLFQGLKLVSMMVWDALYSMCSKQKQEWNKKRLKYLWCLVMAIYIYPSYM